MSYDGVFCAKDAKIPVGFGLIFALFLGTVLIYCLGLSSLCLIFAYGFVNFIGLINSVFRSCLLLCGGTIFNQNSLKSADVQLSNNYKTYTIFIALYKEKMPIVRQLIEGLEALDYDSELVEIFLILEEDDFETKAVIEAVFAGVLTHKKYITVLVPYSLPRTKPKALNYALKLANSEYLVVYDAEDIPQKVQLRKALTQFERYPQVVCLQARLRFYNASQNIITGLMELEYRSWFDYMLNTLSALNLIIPLGGTSCHFRMDILKKIGGWDSYNVTEDAEIGVRLKCENYRTMVLDSYTQEEATASVKAWIRQRSRWIKGFIITYLVYRKNKTHMMSKLGLLDLFVFEFIIGTSGVVFILYFLTFALLRPFTFELTNPPQIIEVLSTLNLYSFSGMALIFTAIAFKDAPKTRFYWCCCVPLYFTLHFFASLIALWEVYKSPTLWRKTEHISALTKKTKNSAKS
jgi:cellulose synthase/poly-beta-1,6-N-acetylglucosamine synthase-like glycosyltransferase